MLSHQSCCCPGALQSLENDLAAARKELEQAAADARTLQQVTRVKDTDVASLTKALDASKAALAGAKQEAAAAAAQLKVCARLVGRPGVQWRTREWVSGGQLVSGLWDTTHENV
jgi:hypothetical protein